MQRHPLMGTLAAVMALALSSTPAEAKPTGPPNVVFILADDLGWAELGCYGNRFNETPNLDRLALDGMRFTDAYAAAPVCSPYRVALMTGQCPARVGVTDYLRPDTDWHLPDAILTMAGLFKSAGYVTGMAGKWHLSGYDKNGVKSGPAKHGFDEVMVSEQTGIGGGSYFHPYKNVNPKLGTVLDGHEYLTDRLNHEAVEFIKRNADKPFFLYLSHYAVHTRLAAKPSDVERFSSKNGATQERAAGTFKGQPEGEAGNPLLAAMLESIDDGVGMILRTLESQGLANHTIIIFTGDNGGEHWVTSNAPLRNGKSSLYEGGIRVPLVVKWPGVTKPGSVCDSPTMNIDFHPTIAVLLGKPEPQTHVIDGVSMMPLLQGGMPADRPLFWHYPLDKPHFLGGRSSGAIRMGDWKLIEFFNSGALELYNLADDIGEKTNLAEQQPERVRQLHQLLGKWRTGVSAKLPEGQSYAKP